MIGNVLRAITGVGQRVPPTVANEVSGWMPAMSTAGVTVTPNGSLASTTVLACVNLIARSLASVPLVLYRKTATGAEPAVDHRLYGILHDVANPLQTAMEVRETMFANVLLHGNAYCEIEWGADGFPLALWPMSSDRVGLRITPDRQLIYTYYSDQFGQIALPGWRVHHLRGLATTGLLGISPIRQAAGAVGLALATEQFSALSFENGAHPSLVLSHPAKLSPEAMKNLRSSFEMQWSGLSNAHRIAVVGEGVKPEAVNVTAAEAQVQETRVFQVAEICRIYNVAPGLVGASETQTYASAEQDMIRFRELTLGPWAEALEKRIAIDLLTPQERADYFAQHKLAKLQATDLATRYSTYNIAKQAGILTTNEIRQMEDYNPVEGGDELWMPMNMAPASAVAEQAGGHTGSDQANDQINHPDDTMDDQSQADSAARAALDALIADVERRVRGRVGNDVRQAGGKALRNGGRLALSDWGETMMHGWREAGEEMLQPVTQMAAALGGTAAIDVGDWVASAYQASVRSLVGGDDGS